MADDSPDPPNRRDPDPLEVELESLRPVAISDGCDDRIGTRLNEGRIGHSASRARRWVLGGLAAAACVLTAFYIRGLPRDDREPTGEIATTLPTGLGPVAVARDALPPPSVAAYRRALAQSTAELDALLDAHAAQVFPPPGAAPAGDAFHGSRAQRSTLNGDTL